METTVDDHHPSDEALRAYCSGALGGGPAEAVGRHVETCPDCQRRALELSPGRPIGRPDDADVPLDEYTTTASRADDLAMAPTEYHAPAAAGPLKAPPGLPEHPDYEITRELGRGGMGVVYLARNKLMGRTEVLKVVGSHLLNTPGVFDRFLAEIRNAARLHHPNIVTAYSALRLGDSLVLAMEHIEGLDLAKLVEARGPMPVANACNYAYQAALGLQHAHEHGMVHRDIKPSNLMLARQGSRALIKVLDFGLAKIQSEGTVNGPMTYEGQLLGSPAYMAPEQIRDARLADIRADIYSLGCSLYELLSGTPPFRGTSLFEILKSHHSSEATPLNLKRPDVPVELADLVARMMAKVPDRRFQTPAEVARALASFFKKASRTPEAAAVGASRGDDPAVDIATGGAIDGAPAPAPASTTAADRDPARPEAMWKSLIDFTEPEDDPPPPAVATGPGDGNPRWSRLAAGLLGFAAILLCAGLIARRAADQGEPVAVAVAGPPGRGDTTAEPIARRPPPAAPTPSPGSTGTAAEKIDRRPSDEAALGEGAKAPSEPGKQEAPPVASGPVVWNGWSKDDPPPATAPFDAARARAHQEAWARHLGVPVEYSNSIGMKFVLIPPGEFTMGGAPAEIEESLKAAGEDGPSRTRIGSEAPRHGVILTQAFYLAIREVTQEDYQSTMGKNPSYHARNGPDARSARKAATLDTTNHPVEGVSWNDAAEFCARLSLREDRVPPYTRAGETVSRVEGTGYRLPTEAEWEFACRAGTTTRFGSGDRDEDLSGVGWFGKNAGGRTHNAGRLKSNPFGLFDMHGNVSEWVEDWWGPTYSGQTGERPAIDPEGPSTAGSERVIRGGSWNQGAASCRSSRRDAAGPTSRNNQIGFRIALGVDAVKQTLDRNPPPSAEAGTNRRGSPARAPRPAVAPFDASHARAYQQAWARHLGVPVEYSNSIGMRLVLIPPGEFTMGSTPAEIEEALQVTGDGEKASKWPSCIRSESPRHKVILTRPSYLGVHEVRQKDYEAVMGKNPSCFTRTGPDPRSAAKVAGLDTANFPVDNVSWNDAAEFCARLSRKENLRPSYFRSGETVSRVEGTGYRLPTEAEWEFACRAGTTTRFWSGDRDEDLIRVGWFGANSGRRMHAVAELSSNPFGLFDMHGNAFEWVEDWWEPTYYGQFAEKPAINPSGPSSPTPLHINRGGNYDNFSVNNRSATRYTHAADSHWLIYGFRVSLPVDAVRQAIADQGTPTNGRSDGPATGKGR